MNHTIDDVVDAVRDALQGVSPNLDTTGFTTAIAYPPLSTQLHLGDIPLDQFIRPTLGVHAYVAADIYEDFINHYILGHDTPDLSPRDYLIRHLDITKSDGKWLFPKVKEQGDLVKLAIFYLIRLTWAIGKASGNQICISDGTLVIHGLPKVGIFQGEIKSAWFEGQLPRVTMDIAKIIYASSETPRLRLRGDGLIRAYHNAGSLTDAAQVRMALRILAAGYKQKLNLSMELNPPTRKPVGKSFRKNLRRVAGEIRGFPGNPSHYIVAELVNTEVIDKDMLFDALPDFRAHTKHAWNYPTDRDVIKVWSRELRKLGG